MRFASWNINQIKRFARLSGQAALLRSIDADIVALQEVTHQSFKQLRQTLGYDWSICSLDHANGECAIKGKTALGTALFGRFPFKLVDAALLKATTLPERFLIANVSFESTDITVCSFHIPCGSTWKSGKSAAFRAIAEWAVRQTMPTLIGIDANAPKVDHPVHKQNAWWRDGEADFLGPKTNHTMQDVLRILFRDNPDRFDAVAEQYPNGPLAVSYRRGKAAPISCRYDFIYVSPHFSVQEVSYPYDSSLAAGSDHSIVVADLNP